LDDMRHSLSDWWPARLGECLEKINEIRNEKKKKRKDYAGSDNTPSII